MTSDTPHWFFRLVHKAALVRQIRTQILGFVGISPLHVTHFSAVINSSPETRAKWSRSPARLRAM
nr:hypothetical protein [Rhodovulum sulfidophilum]